MSNLASLDVLTKPDRIPDGDEKSWEYLIKNTCSTARCQGTRRTFRLETGSCAGGSIIPQHIALDRIRPAISRVSSYRESDDLAQRLAS